MGIDRHCKSGLLLLAFACACTTKLADEQGPLLPQIAKRVEGIGKRTLGLEVEIEGRNRRQTRAIALWFAEALLQSPFLDLELDRQMPARIVLRGEFPKDTAKTAVLSTSFVEEGKAPVPLAGPSSFAHKELVTALDLIAVESRLGLGEARASVQEHRKTIEAIVSPFLRVARACADARRWVKQRKFANAIGELKRALQLDPNCALAITGLAAIYMDLGKPRLALKMTERIDSLPGRMSTQTVHDAKRISLLAKSDFQGLIDLADLVILQRPRDARVRFTKALGLCMQAKYEEALPILEAIRKRLGADPGVLFCLSHALIALGRQQDVLGLMPELEKVLALPLVLRIKALALDKAGKHEELASYLQSKRQGSSFRRGMALVELLGMQAAHAIATGKDALGAKLILEQLDVLRAAPSLSAKTPSLLIDAAWVLSRLGKAKDCEVMLLSLQGKEGFAEAIALHGRVALYICRVQQGKAVTERALNTIEQRGYPGWRHRLLAQIELRKGNAQKALRHLQLSMPGQKDPAADYELAECLKALGQHAQAKQMLRPWRKLMSFPRMDKPQNHPLMRSKYAMIYRAAGKS